MRTSIAATLPRIATLILALAQGCGDDPDENPPAATSNPPSVADCPIFPADDDWNVRIDDAPTDAAYTAILQRYLGVAENQKLQPDFGADFEGGTFGIPFNVVPETQPLVPIAFDFDDADPGPYPFPGPELIRIEGDKPYDAEPEMGRVLVVQRGACMLWEAWGCRYDTQWKCGVGAKFDLTRGSYGQREKRLASTEASGLPVFAGLVRRDEAESGDINHALRFTLRCISEEFTRPASNSRAPTLPTCDPNRDDLLPMGTRVRLRRDYDVSALEGSARAIAQALKKHGMILAANGGDLHIQGAPDSSWDDEQLHTLGTIPYSALEVVGPVMPEL